jgi:carbon-monoxide dehydrogenase large subunit
VPRAWPFAFTNGIQASYLEVDTESGFVTLLKHWCVEDCGTVINPQLVDEQIRGGVVQGLGGALFEHCIYDERGQLTNGNMADYLVPMAAEMPDIEIGHVVTPIPDSNWAPRARAATAGAPGAVMNAINVRYDRSVPNMSAKHAVHAGAHPQALDRVSLFPRIAGRGHGAGIVKHGKTRG